MNALVQLVGISKTFGDAAAVHATDLSIERGKTTVLIGPSGCGKSTLLRLIIGLIQPDDGEIQFDGTQLLADKIGIVRRRVGYVIQEGGLFPHLTARGNVLLMARHLRRDENEMRSRLSELCALTRFPENLLERYPRELSGGQRQRVSLMRALMLSPELLLLDELAKRTLSESGVSTEHRQGMGGTIILWEALRTGQIDVYPEYTGTIAQEILKRSDRLSFDQIAGELAKSGVGSTQPLGFNNTYALVV